MADMLLGPAMEKLFELLVEEAKSLRGVRGEVESLRVELDIIQSFLNDVDARSSRSRIDETIKTWVRQVREEADHIVDVVDQYRSLEAERRSQRGVVGFVRDKCCLVKSVGQRHYLASEIESIKESLRKIKERAQTFGLRPLEQGTSARDNSEEERNLRMSSLFVEEDELVGVDATARDVIANLVGGSPTRSVFSLTGQGGIGKTTLAKKIFEDEAMKERFDCSAWITVSQSYNVERLLKLAGKQLCLTEQPAGGIETVEELVGRLRKHLGTKRYVVVFDDVWQLDFWEVIKHALPNNNMASRIIMTTRNASIAHSVKETPYDSVEELKAWPPELAWELFCKKAFRFELDGKCPRELEDLSREILSKCHGLPLVIAATAGLLWTKEKSVIEWQRMVDNLNYEFETNPQLSNVLKILSLSYYDLPYHLRSCFLYFGMFPEDYSIFEGKLYRFWIAEGFIKPKRDKTLEEVAEEYLNELVNRNVVSIEIKYGYKKWCHVHDLMREVICTAADELGYFRVLGGNKPSTRGKCRRLSVHMAKRDVLKTVEEYSARSVFLFNVEEMTNSFLVSFFETFRLLKVLDFQRAPLDSLPKEVGNLFHLEYLNLKGTNLKVLPKSIGKLQNLLTLDVRETFIDELPIEVYKLRKLRHLLAYRRDKEFEYNSNSFPGVRMREGIGSLQELQTLTHVEVYPSQDGFVKELEKLEKLKLLSLSKLTTQNAGTLRASIEKMSCLEDLSLTSMDEGEVLDLDRVLSPPPTLQYLSLKCRLREFPKWISTLQNLRGLSMRFSKLTEEPLHHLKRLPNLAFLRLYQTYDGVELHFEEGGFRKLKQLELRKLEGLKRVKVDRGALPLLEELSFGDFPQMKDVSFDIQHVTSLKSLEIGDMGREFVASLQPEGGLDYWKIKHIPSVRFSFKREGKAFDYYKLSSFELLQRLQQEKQAGDDYADVIACGWH